jgi:hypothetical protein
MFFVVTIDTEEDNWSNFSTTENPVSNIDRLTPLQQLFDEFGIRPTYLISYPVATNPQSVSVLKKILKHGRCEIGTHCHPWNTPPFDGKIILEKETMLCNLPDTQVLEKLNAHHQVIQENFGVTPVSFRAGRWGFGPSVAKALSSLGYRVDTSVSPYTDWSIYHGPDFSGFGPGIFRFSASGIDQPAQDGELLQVPASVGYLQSNFDLCRQWETALARPLLRKLHIPGILKRMKLLNKVWLSPEQASADEMIGLARMLIKMLIKNRYSVLNMMFHSTCLKAGLCPFVKSRQQEIAFIEKIRTFLTFITTIDVTKCTLCEVEYNLQRELIDPCEKDTI